MGTLKRNDSFAPWVRRREEVEEEVFSRRLHGDPGNLGERRRLGGGGGLEGSGERVWMGSRMGQTLDTGYGNGYWRAVEQCVCNVRA